MSANVADSGKRSASGSERLDWLVSRVPSWFFWAAGLSVLTAAMVLVDWSWLRSFPEDFVFGREIGHWIDDRLDWMKANLDFIFSSVKYSIDSTFVPLKEFLLWLPWPVFVIGLGVLSWRLAGARMGLFALSTLLLVGVFGHWESAMETVALMVVTVALCVLVAVPIGIWASQSDRMDSVLKPILDTMQTMPSFVYLVPAIAFFAIGNVPAVIATLIYAIPPGVRLTNLGIRQVPEETVEAARSFGATGWQLMFKVRIPLAMPTIMAGVNQTTLMALAMVVIASLVGAGGLGEDILRGLARQESGNTLLAGFGIVFLAIIIDRNTQAFARRQEEALGITRSMG